MALVFVGHPRLVATERWRHSSNKLKSGGIIFGNECSDCGPLRPNTFVNLDQHKDQATASGGQNPDLFSFAFLNLDYYTYKYAIQAMLEQ
jgi:hypothetical protein